MSLEIPHTFHRFRMTDQEAIAASVLTVMQKQHVHNLRVEAAEMLLNVEDDPLNPLSKLQERARLRGLLDAYAGLISLSQAGEEVLSQVDPNS